MPIASLIHSRAWPDLLCG